MSNVGIPIKLLYEAEGMKVTVEVGDQSDKILRPAEALVAVIVWCAYLVYITCH